ncbi:Rz lytic protein [Pantoea rodasii]|uniref:Rz lytic protein n=1 Tax=Pantoea rodasii TaxID=1076549 RepID=UPI001F0C269B|nr:Rz lytic protein [Pantoea rodasii]
MLNILNLFRNVLPLFVIALICVELGLIIDSNSRLKTTNQHLTEMLGSKEAQVSALRSKNDALANGLNELVTAVRQQNAVMKQVTTERVVASQENRTLRDEIRKNLVGDRCAASPVPAAAADRLRDAARAAGRVPDRQTAAAEPSGRTDRPR